MFLQNEEECMSREKLSGVEMIGALQQMEAGPTAAGLLGAAPIYAISPSPNKTYA